MKSALRKSFALLLLLCTFAVALVLCAQAETYGDLTYTVSKGEVTITDCSSSATTVTIPSEIDGNPVTRIGNYAFSYCSCLTSISIPDSVTRIGDSAFLYCSSLTSITIPDSVASIGYSAFLYCSSLTRISIPDSVTSIGGSAFEGCSNLASITIPSGVTSIGAYAFYGCSSLASITIPDSVTSIEKFAFEDCRSLTGIYVDAHNPNYTDIDGVLFSKDKTALIQAPGALSGTYVIPEGVISIESSAFYYCSNLTSITIPDSVVDIGNYAFSGCKSLTHIHADEKNPNYADVNGVLLDKAKTTLMYAPGALSGAYTVPLGVTDIGYNAFCDCEGLTSIIIPKSVMSIGGFAFSGCKNLTSIAALNPQCSITGGRYTFPSSATIYGYAGSTAEAYAAKYSRTFVALEKHTHTYAADFTVDVSATCVGKGEKSRHCTVCDAKTDVTVIPATGKHTYGADNHCTVCGAEKPPYTPGDCTDDDEIDKRDLLRLQKYLADWDVEINMDAADCNGDGTVDKRDLLRLQKYLADWDVKLGE